MKTAGAHESRRRTKRFGAGGLALPVAAGLLGALVVPPAAHAARPVGVDCDAGDDLQTAIDAADRNARIQVSGTCVGTYVVTAESLKIEGEPGAALDGGGDGPVVTVAAGSTATLSDLVVTGGDTTGLSAVGGIDNRGDLSLERVTVTGNRAHSVGAFAGDFGRAIGGIDSSGTLVAFDSTVTANSAVAEADLWAVLVGVGGINNNAGDLAMYRSSVSDNDLEFRASPSADAFVVGSGGVQLDGPTSFSDMMVERNSATSHANNGLLSGGVQGLGSVPLSIHDSQVSDNTGSVSRSGTTNVSGGVALFDNALDMTGTTVSENTAVAADAATQLVGGVYVADSASVEIVVSAISANHATGGDALAIGGLLMESAERSVVASVSDVSIDHNSASASGEAYGGVHLLSVELVASNVDVVGNDAAAGGVAVGGLRAAQSDGHPGSMVTLNDAWVQSNTASAGSALGGILVDDASTVVLRDGSVNLNTPGNCSFVDPVCAI